MSMYRVTWTDSGTQSSDGWEPAADIIRKTGITHVVTVGHYMGETSDTLYIALSHDPVNDLYFGAQAIQKSAITSNIRLGAIITEDTYDRDRDIC